MYGMASPYAFCYPYAYSYAYPTEYYFVPATAVDLSRNNNFPTEVFPEYRSKNNYETKSPECRNNRKSFTIASILELEDSATAKDSDCERKRKCQRTSPYSVKDKMRKLDDCNGRINEAKDKDDAKAKRHRTVFTPQQLDVMEKEFDNQQYMVGNERLILASSLNLTEPQIKVWFQNRRIKWRREREEMEKAKLESLRSEDSNGLHATPEDQRSYDRLDNGCKQE